jgi:hypothetical protein
MRFYGRLQENKGSRVNSSSASASIVDPHTFLSAALMAFIFVVGLFCVDTHISKKVRTAR